MVGSYNIKRQPFPHRILGKLFSTAISRTLGVGGEQSLEKALLGRICSIAPL